MHFIQLNSGYPREITIDRYVNCSFCRVISHSPINDHINCSFYRMTAPTYHTSTYEQQLLQTRRPSTLLHSQLTFTPLPLTSNNYSKPFALPHHTRTTYLLTHFHFPASAYPRSITAWSLSHSAWIVPLFMR